MKYLSKGVRKGVALMLSAFLIAGNSAPAFAAASELESTEFSVPVPDTKPMDRSTPSGAQNKEDGGDFALNAGRAADAWVPDGGFVTGLSAPAIADGTPGWDENDDAGNDSGPNNGVVRSFDSISYILEYTMDVKRTGATPSDAYQNGILEVEFILPVEKTVAEFDLGSMAWLENARVESVAGGQVLTGIRRFSAGQGSQAIPGTGSVNAIVKVYGGANGDVIQPQFSLWLEGNGQAEQKIAQAASVRISAAPRYNVRLVKNKALNWKGSFDLATGTAAGSATADADKVNGRMYGYGVTLQLYNTKAGESGLKGIELPKGPIEFDLELKMEQGDGTNIVDVTDTVTPTLWDYSMNSKSTRTGENGRNMYWNDLDKTAFAYLAAPYGKSNGAGTRKDSVYDTGNLRMELDPVTDRIHVTIRDYDFGDMLFPEWHAGENRPGIVVYPKTQGCFAAGYFQILIPTDDMLGDKSYYLSVADTDFTAASLSDQPVTDQMDAKDDTLRDQVFLSSRGEYDKRNWLTKRGATSWGSDNILMSNYEKGDALSVPGETIMIWGGFTVDAIADAEFFVESADILQKFDDNAFEIPAGSGPDAGRVSRDYTSTNMKFKIYYAAKQDGTGWQSDEEMLECRQDQLDYYETIDQLMADGRICVAVLMEGRLPAGGVPVGGGGAVQVGIDVKLKEDAQPGVVYQTVNDVILWNQDVIRNGESGAVPAPIMSLNSGTDTRYRYVKSAYDQNGQIMVNTHVNSYRAGQSLLISAYDATVTKHIDQQSTTTVGEKTVFDLDAGQRQVDYVLEPKLVMRIPEGGTSNQPLITQVVIRDILPANIHYVEGSAVLGGIYHQSEGEMGGTMEGGIPLEPEILQETVTIPGTEGSRLNATVLQWVIPDVDVTQGIEKIHFSCNIGTPEDPKTDVSTGQNFQNMALIRAGEDKQISYSSINLQVIKLQASSLTKKILTPLVEIGEDVEYEIFISNSSGQTIRNTKVLDILPYNQARISGFDGSYSVASVTVDFAKAPQTLDYIKNSDRENAWKGYMADEQAMRNQDAQTVRWEDMTELNAGGLQGTEFTYVVPAGSETAVLGFQGTLVAQEVLRIKVRLHPVGNAAGNIYQSDTSSFYDGLPNVVPAPKVQAKVVGRTIEGIAWNDSNKNGRRDVGEVLLPGVTVHLLDSSGLPVKDVTGVPIVPKVTAVGGDYRFEQVPEGKYQIRFTDGSYSGVAFADWKATTKMMAGVPEELDSNALGYYNGTVLSYAQIDDLVLPDKKALTQDTVFVHTHMDAGFYWTEPEPVPPVISKYTLTKSSDPAGGNALNAAGKPTDGKSVTAGQRITYTVRLNVLENKLEDAILSDTLPIGMTFVPGSITLQVPGEETVAVEDSASVMEPFVWTREPTLLECQC